MRVIHHIAVERNLAGDGALTLGAEHEHLPTERLELCRPGQRYVRGVLLTLVGLKDNEFGNGGPTDVVADLWEFAR